MQEKWLVQYHNILFLQIDNSIDGSWRRLFFFLKKAKNELGWAFVLNWAVPIKNCSSYGSSHAWGGCNSGGCFFSILTSSPKLWGLGDRSFSLGLLTASEKERSGWLSKDNRRGPPASHLIVRCERMGLWEETALKGSLLTSHARSSKGTQSCLLSSVPV